MATGSDEKHFLPLDRDAEAGQAAAGIGYRIHSAGEDRDRAQPEVRRVFTPTAGGREDPEQYSQPEHEGVCPNAVYLR